MGRGLSEQQWQVLAVLAFEDDEFLNAAPEKSVRQKVWRPSASRHNRQIYSDVQRASMARTLRRLQDRGLIEECELQRKVLGMKFGVDGYSLTDAGETFVAANYSKLLAVHTAMRRLSVSTIMGATANR